MELFAPADVRDRRRHPDAPPQRRPGATALLYAGPLLALLLAGRACRSSGAPRRSILRDVLNSHFPMKWSQAEALRSGTFPLIDPYRAGRPAARGQPERGAVLSDQRSSISWARPSGRFNAHFWLHLLLAPFAFYWMCRSWGLGREAVVGGRGLLA